MAFQNHISRGDLGSHVHFISATRVSSSCWRPAGRIQARVARFGTRRTASSFALGIPLTRASLASLAPAPCRAARPRLPPRFVNQLPNRWVLVADDVRKPVVPPLANVVGSASVVHCCVADVPNPRRERQASAAGAADVC